MKDRINCGIGLGFDTFKLKLNGVDDRRLISDFRSLTDAPFAVDANQSWADSNAAIKFSKELSELGCLLIEQPFDKYDMILTAQLAKEIEMPIIADEACQRDEDINRLSTVFSGVNIKLQKCGGILPAYNMIKRAKSLGMQVLIGCMSESNIGCAAGEVLSPLCDWNDLDGRFLVKEIPFRN